MSRYWQGVCWLAFIACCCGLGRSPCRAAEISEIVQRATAALNSDWASDPLYACVEKDEVQKGDRLTSKTFEVVMIDDSDYHLPLAVNGQPLPSDRQKAELLKLKHGVGRRKNESPSARRARVNAWKKQRDENGGAAA